MNHYALTLLALTLLVSVPFALKPEYSHDPARAQSAADVLTIITPHNEAIRDEFTTAFRRHMLEAEGREVFLEWRVPGGASEIEKMLETEFMFAFRRYWTDELGKPWTSEIEANFNNARTEAAKVYVDPSPARLAKRAFLDSKVGSGIDLFFGGGAYAFVVQANKGHLVDSGVFETHPEWFSDNVIPYEVGGEIFYDKERRWIGSCLTTFGICYNTDALKLLAVEPTGAGWELLADPRLHGEVGLADPTKSGGVIKAFEMIFQQQMRLAVERTGGKATPASLAEGWEAALRLIQRMAGNARYFTLFSSKVPSDVARGDVAAGMCIDYYGRTYNEQLRQANGDSRVQYFTPLGGSSTSVDPIAMLRGAPNPHLAKKFMEFMFSAKGQKLWNYRAGLPDGPVKQALRRLSVRRDLYLTDLRQHFADPEVDPYEEMRHFRYEPAWTAKIFDSIRAIMASACLDSHDELRAAWRALIQANFPPQANAAFHDLSAVTYERAQNEIAATLRASKQEQAIARRQLTESFQANYLRAKSLAEAGQ